MALELQGTVVTFDDARTVIEDGVVYINDGKIAGVASSTDPAPDGFPKAPRVDTGAYVYPGLIDLHSHLAYNTLPLWAGEGAPYRDHHSWTREDHPDYGSTISWPSRVLGTVEPEALIKYVEVKALVGGTTSIQGAPHSTRPVKGWLLRIVDVEQLGPLSNPVLVSALQKRVDDLHACGETLRNTGGVFIYHMAEGIQGSAVLSEFTDVTSAGLLQPGLIGVHATALTKDDFTAWEAAAQTGNIVWSPFSNLWLYSKTTDVVEASKQGFRISIGSDWSPSGTKHVLGELKVADIVNKNQFDNRFSDLQLCEMVTRNPGDALAVAWGPLLGRLAKDAEADVAVVAKRRPDPYRNLIEARERDVELVVIRGKPYYGTRASMRAAGAARPNAITVAGEKRSVVVKQPGNPDAQLTWSQVVRRLEAVRRDPVKAWRNAVDALAAWGGPLDAPEAPLVLYGDMPEGDTGLMAAAGEVPLDLTIPPLDSLEHDADFFKAIDAVDVPELGHLRDFYE
ncbi:MAG TPA: amidohydrolase family protein [Gaiellaceae bacterium]